jgi:hypothetical protein
MGFVRVLKFSIYLFSVSFLKFEGVPQRAWHDKAFLAKIGVMTKSGRTMKVEDQSEISLKHEPLIKDS